MSEQANNGCAAGFGVRLIGCTDDVVLPIGMHDYAEALGCCALVDKTMFIADMLDCLNRQIMVVLPALAYV